MNILRGVLLLVSVSMIAVVFATSDNRLDARLGFGVAIGAQGITLQGTGQHSRHRSTTRWFTNITRCTPGRAG